MFFRCCVNPFWLSFDDFLVSLCLFPNDFASVSNAINLNGAKRFLTFNVIWFLVAMIFVPQFFVLLLPTVFALPFFFHHHFFVVFFHLFFYDFCCFCCLKTRFKYSKKKNRRLTAMWLFRSSIVHNVFFFCFSFSIKLNHIILFRFWFASVQMQKKKQQKTPPVDRRLNCLIISDFPWNYFIFTVK